jgi:hypothetical protein
MNKVEEQKATLLKYVLFPMPTINVCRVVLQKVSDGKGLVLDVFGKVERMLN